MVIPPRVSREIPPETVSPSEGDSIYDIPFTLEACDVCDKQIKDPCQLRKHLVKQHGLSVLYKCPCGQYFKAYGDGMKHYNKGCKKQYGPQSQGGEGFPCKYCERTFPTSMGRTQHVRRSHPEADPRRQLLVVTSGSPNSSIAKSSPTDNAESEPNMNPNSSGPLLESRSLAQQSGSGSVVTSADQRSPEGESPMEPQPVSSVIEDLPGSRTTDPGREAVFGTSIERLIHDFGGPSVLPSGACSPSSDEVSRPLDDSEVFEGPIVDVQHPDPLPKIVEWREEGWQKVVQNVAEGELGGNGRGQEPELDPLVSAYRDGLLTIIEGRQRSKDLDEKLDRWIESLSNELGGCSISQRPQGISRAAAVAFRRRRLDRRQRYGATQNLFRRDPKRLAEAVWKGVDPLEGRPNVVPTAEGVKSLYRDLWGSGGTVSLDLGPAAGEKHDPPPLITAQEVHKRIWGHGDSAPGPDGLKRFRLKKVGMDALLALYFNTLLLTSHYPKSWKVARTVLIPKDGKDPVRPENWRPLTISSLMARTYSGLLEKRLRDQVKIHVRQKGFVEGQGCATNALLLNRLIRRAKTQGGCAVVLDIAKAFDTVPQSVWTPILEHHGVSPVLTDIILRMYRNTSTLFQLPDGNHWLLNLKRGVKQGDPLSPLLFNLLMNPLLAKLEKAGSVWRVRRGDTSHFPCNSLAFADDLVLIAETGERLQSLLQIVDDFLGSVSMTLAPLKCSALGWKKIGHNQWQPYDPRVNYRGVPIPVLGRDDTLKYLGVELGYDGITSEAMLGTINDIMSRVSRLYLKPEQKIRLLTVYILPRFNHALRIALPPQKLLQEFDANIRKHAKRILKLHHSTTDGILHCRLRDGGLAIPRMQEVSELGYLGIIGEIERSDDQVLRSEVMTEECENRVEALKRKYNVTGPLTNTELKKTRARLKDAEYERWCSQDAHGAGVFEFGDDPVGNTWLTKFRTLKSSRFIQALKFRTNTAPTRATLSRYKPIPDDSCRRCHAARETLGHILGQCESTKNRWLHRHDEIRDMLYRYLSKRRGCTVAREESFSMDVQGPPGQPVNIVTLKPDLVLFDRESKSLTVIDVCVPMEYNLTMHCENKISKYEPLLPTLKARYGAARVQVRPIGIGARGAVGRDTRHHLTMLRIPRSLQVAMATSALRSSLEMFAAFMDGRTLRRRRR